MATGDDTHPETTKLSDALHNPLFLGGDRHYYNLEYDAALRDYGEDQRAHPTDIFAINQVLKVVIFKELYRLNLLDTTLYAHDGFLNTTQPENADPKVRARMEEIYQRALMLENNRLELNSKDADALYCRGVTRGLKSTYMALVDKSFISALQNAMGARRDHERVLQLDPGYTDAKMTVGTDLYIVGSLPLPLKVLAGITGQSGNKKKGPQYLSDVAAANGGASIDARVALAFFLRREARYGEALKIVQRLRAEHPRNFLFSLEEANLLKDEGNGSAAAAAYRALLDNPSRFSDAHFELAAFGLGEVLRGQKDYAGAQKEYDVAAEMKTAQPQLKARALLAAGEMYDQTGNREMALQRYDQTVRSDTTGRYAGIAQKRMLHSFSAGRPGQAEIDF